MTLRAVAVEGFGGLDLRLDASESASAIDALNVTFEQGRVRTRPGSATVWAHGDGVPLTSLHEHRATGSESTRHLITANETGKLYAVLAPAGTLVSSVATGESPAAAGASAVSVGTPVANYTYVALGRAAGTGTVRRWDGAAWSTPAAFGAAPFTARPFCLGLSQADNRLVAAEGSTLRFSDPGAPEAFSTNNFVELTPGDGETITAMATYANQLIVFKRSKFFVFYGNSTDSTGEPVFNYRTIDSDIGVRQFMPQSVCTGRDGVYFVADDGIYRTTGIAPQRVSTPLDPMFRGEAGPFWLGLSRWRPDVDTKVRIGFVGDRLYVSYATTSGTRVWLVYDSNLDTWSYWTGLGGGGMLGSLVGSPTYTGVHVAGDLGIARLDIATTTDEGTAIASRWRSGFLALGGAQSKTVRETILEGFGSPTLQWSADWGALETGAAVTLGTAPAYATGRRRFAVTGRRHSFQVGANSGAWLLARAQVNVEAPRDPAVT